MTDKKIFFSLSVLLLQEDVIWVAQCLEKDIVAQGESISDAIKAFKHTLIGQIVLDIKYNKTASIKDAWRDIRIGFIILCIEEDTTIPDETTW